MRRPWTAGIAALGFVLVASSVAVATDDADPSDSYFVRRAEVAALVLAQDPRFTDIADYDRLERRAAGNFDNFLLFAADYYRVLPTPTAAFSPWPYEFDHPVHWLVEVMLVQGCAELPGDEQPSADTLPWPDPCGWRHNRYYRVAPDDAVTLLCEEGHPDPMPAE